jgi:hypothetical protein
VVNPLWFTVPDPLTGSIIVDSEEAIRRIRATFDLSVPGVPEKLAATDALLALAREHTRRTWADQEAVPSAVREYLASKFHELQADEATRAPTRK